MTIHMIWAEAQNRVIGNAGEIPWRIPGEQKVFRERTMGATVVMGRGTWESLPERVRPLPGRRNVVLSRRPGWSAPGAEVLSSIDELLGEQDEFWVMGGAEIYAALLPHADHIVRTRIDLAVDGDTWAPELGPEWQLEKAEQTDAYVVEDLRRSGPARPGA
ncbi:dihydrofolate reductase [Winogradskya consettensis]|uniref:Dihydrofolate reductase n=1 Tax=Winogradskya consettensis TaxID=113560 RepID=A0A919SYC5_9ACTN|nr:dihydrofolate reductase [Actinoplanes consettensis]GIM80737.1 dihydrofolate reductase [Actinoplanes consettensis]